VAPLALGLCRYSSFAGARHGVGVFGEDAALEAWFGGFEVFEALLHLFVGDVEREFAVGDVEGDGVAFADGGDGAAELSFGGDVAGHEAARGAGEAAIC